jgi:hypothetical protein
LIINFVDKDPMLTRKHEDYSKCKELVPWEKSFDGIHKIIYG